MEQTDMDYDKTLMAKLLDQLDTEHMFSLSPEQRVIVDRTLRMDADELARRRRQYEHEDAQRNLKATASKLLKELPKSETTKCSIQVWHSYRHTPCHVKATRYYAGVDQCGLHALKALTSDLEAKARGW